MTVWCKRLAKAEKYMQEAHAHGRRVYERYQDARGDQLGAAIKRANIFYANVNTLKESLFNSLPKPDVSRVHRGDVDDPVARVAALLMQRALDYEIKSGMDFKESVRAAILDRLVPGIGQVWVRFEMDEQEVEQLDPATGEVVRVKMPVEGSEQLFLDAVYWEDFLYGPARDWASVPWVSRRLSLSKAEIVGRWGEEAMANVPSAKDTLSDITPKEINEGKYTVYEIWDKVSRKVYWVCKGAEDPLEVKDDPYQLRGFFPCPKPLVANPTTAAFLPVTDYHLAQDQYTQLDVLYARISLIIDAVKVAGLYNSANQSSVGWMLQGAENKLIPVDDWAMLQETGGARGNIDWYPVEQVVTVLQQLQAQYEAIKGVLQEVSGMADIVRGSSNQYETAAAQQIKAQFASVRMNGYQRDVAEFVTGILNIVGELMVQLYSDEKLKAIVGNIMPEDQQYLLPAVQLLRDDRLLQFKVSIQADSLTQSDWALEKGQRMELMGYVSQFLQSMQGSPPDLQPMLLTMLKFTIAGYRGSAEVEGVISQQLESIIKQQQEAAANPQPPPPSPEEIKAQAEVQKMQMETQLKQQEAQQSAMLEQQAAENRLALERAQAELDAEVQRQKAEFEALLQEQKMQFREREFAMELAHLQEKQRMELEFRAQEQGLKLQAQMAKARMDREAAEEAAEVEEPESEED